MRFRPSLCVLLAVALGIAGCGGSPTQTPRSETSPTPTKSVSARIVLSGDTAGFIVPCGCASKQFGGLPRRGTYLGGVRKNGNVVYVDAGGSVHRATTYDGIKLEYLWKGMAAFGPAALNLGPGEIAMGRARLANLAATVPLVSSNVDGGPWPKHRSVEIGGQSIAFIGICHTSASGEGLRVRDPEAALRELVPELARTHAAVVLLAYAEESVCMRLIQNFPELSAVLAAGTHQPIPPRMIDGRTLFTSATQKGKFLATATVELGGKTTFAPGEIVELSEAFADDPAQVANLDAYKARLKKEELPPDATGEAPALLASLPRGYQYAGSRVCAECHEKDAALHTASKHAHGLETLSHQNFDFDPYCLKCHTTGYGAPGGFVSAPKSSALGGIGCENCHGPSLAHAQEPHTRTLANAKTACVTCHDSENSPLFNYEAYWPRILHGREKATRRTPASASSAAPVREGPR